jgi:hypothetical protein
MMGSLRSLASAAALLGAAMVAPAQAATNTTSGALTLSVSGPDQAAVGQSITMTLTATNTSSVTLTSAELGVGFSQASAKLVAPAPNPDLCGRGGNGGVSMGISCFIGDLQPGTSTTITFGLQPQAAGTLNITTAASFFMNGVWQTVPGGLSIPVAPAPTDVQISGSASTGSPQVGSSFRYVFQVKDGSGQPAYGVSFTDTLPQTESLLGAFASTGAPCSISGATATCSLGDLAAGGQATVTINVQAPSTLGSLTDTASAYATNADTDLANNSVAVTVSVK